MASEVIFYEVVVINQWWIGERRIRSDLPNKSCQSTASPYSHSFWFENSNIS